MKLELATIEFSIEVKDGKYQYGYPKFDILQDNTKEVLQHIPNGKYVWKLALDIDKAEKNDL